jgi:exopolysaccharide production protein ExoZ
MSVDPAADPLGRRNQSLDLLRGMAILMVVAAHCGLTTTSFVPGLAAVVGGYGQLGVQLFFIVSGYTMMLTYGDRVDLAAARAFYIRRVFRIVPLFWIALVFYLLVTKGEGFREWAPDGVSARDVLLTIFFLHWTSITAFNSVVPGGWSIAVEMQFYLLFPLIIYLFRRNNGPLVTYGLIALVSISAQFLADHYLVPLLAASLSKDPEHLANAFFVCSLPRQLICFGLGILLYDIVERHSRPMLGALFLLAAALCSTWGAMVAILFFVALGVLAKNVTMSALVLFGRHSYAIYLVHFALISAVSALFPLDLLAMFPLVAASALALSYFAIEPMIERRFNRLGHMLAAGIRRRPAVAGITYAFR